MEEGERVVSVGDEDHLERVDAVGSGAEIPDAIPRGDE